MRTKLTRKLVESFLPAAKAYTCWDTEVPKLHVKVTPQGQRSYLVWYRTKDHQERRPKIGDHGEITVEQARKRAQEILGDVARGLDPSALQKTQRIAIVVSQLADRYLSDHADIYNKPRIRNEYRRLVVRHVKPALGAMKAAAVTRADIDRLHKSLRQTPYEANRVLAVLSKMFNLAEVWGIRPDGSNPTRRIQRYPEKKRVRFLTDEEMARLGRGLSRLEHDMPALADAINVVRLLALTGCRLSEVLRLRWENVDLKQCVLRIVDGKAGSRDHDFGAPAAAILEALPRGPSPWVFPARTGNEHRSVTSLEKAWQHVRKASSLPDVRLHDLRHTVGTYAGQAGANAFLVRDKLGHKTLAMTGRYVERDRHPLRALTDTVEARVAAALGQRTPAEIIELKGKERAA